MKWTLVTGGAKRLGAEICLTLAKAGYSVVVHYNTSRTEAEQIVQQCREIGVKAECIQGDFASPESTELFIQSYQERFPNTANLINNVGMYLIKSGLNTTEGEWKTLFQTNVHTPFALIRNLIPTIKENRGNIINLGVSGLQSHQANTYSTAYYMTKQALWSLTRSLASELASSLVRVNMVSPGYLDFAVDLPSDIKKLPMHRAATAEEVSRVIAFLMDPKSAYITGQNIEVAGGVKL